MNGATIVFVESAVVRATNDTACGAAQLPPSGVPDKSVPVAYDGVTYYEDGGDPIYLDGNIYLCARSDGDSQRFFSGSVAQAGFYDVALNASHVQVGLICDTCVYSPCILTAFQ